MPERWEPGQVIVRREVLGLVPEGVEHPDPRPPWYGRAWLGVPVHVVEDTDEQLVTFLGPGAELATTRADWPTEDGLHPWHHKGTWVGHGTLMVQRHDEHHAVWHFWDGPERRFTCWYLNLQTAPSRTEIGYDTQDHELDLVALPDGSHVVKDLELMPIRVAEGRFTQAFVDRILADGEGLRTRLETGERWWDERWTTWAPDPSWRDARLPPGWADVPTAISNSGLNSSR
jgi:hypothetical protein